ncbi:MAG: response regulator [Proteobacteria bacterium]|nr:response regulator [Pseudomonadota bacterium]
MLIYLIEDDITNAELISLYLSKHGYMCVHYSCPLEFLNSIVDIPAPKILLLDIQMPKLDGFTLINHLRTSHPAFLKQSYVIALTALAMQGDEQRCLDAGADFYMSKPFRMGHLLNHIEQIIKDTTKLNHGT